jgi:hypothetical protein
MLRNVSTLSNKGLRQNLPVWVLHNRGRNENAIPSETWAKKTWAMKTWAYLEKDFVTTTTALTII